MREDAEEIKREIICFQFSERIKSEIIIASSLLTKMGGLRDDELSGAKKLMSSFLDGVIMEINLANNVLKLKDFLMARKKVIEIKERINLDQYQEAQKRISEAISHITTCGQRAVETLKERHLL